MSENRGQMWVLIITLKLKSSAPQHANDLIATAINKTTFCQMNDIAYRDTINNVLIIMALHSFCIILSSAILLREHPC